MVLSGQRKASKPICQCSPVLALLLVALAPRSCSSLHMQAPETAAALLEANRTAANSSLQSNGEGLHTRGHLGVDTKVSGLAQHRVDLESATRKAVEAYSYSGPSDLKCLLGLITLVTGFGILVLACGIVVLPQVLIQGKKRGHFKL
mmetsp:Transcript_11284/g.25699  ORF Transcript_11284/g.25699 Transcript_11284/m.25699 type:complete len:147 (+) Transcript_11284:101-541(+)